MVLTLLLDRINVIALHLPTSIPSVKNHIIWRSELSAWNSVQITTQTHTLPPHFMSSRHCTNTLITISVIRIFKQNFTSVGQCWLSAAVISRQATQCIVFIRILAGPPSQNNHTSDQMPAHTNVTVPNKPDML